MCIRDRAKVVRDRPDVVVLTVSVDDGPEDVKPTLQTVLREEPPFGVLFDPEAKIVRDKFGTRLFPETWSVSYTHLVPCGSTNPPESVIRPRVCDSSIAMRASVLRLAESMAVALTSGAFGAPAPSPVRITACSA